MWTTQQQTRDWTEMFLERLPYRRVYGWGGEADHALGDWKRLGFDVEILRVRKLNTRKPGFHDYDLAAIVRARSARMIRGKGCDGDVVVDAQVGLHLTNAGLLHPWMWYGRHASVVTLRCHEGHSWHFKSWLVPKLQSQHGINETILKAISQQYLTSRFLDKSDPLVKAYDIFMSRLPLQEL